MMSYLLSKSLKKVSKAMLSFLYREVSKTIEDPDDIERDLIPFNRL
jgi:hypothetical protein